MDTNTIFGWFFTMNKTILLNNYELVAIKYKSLKFKMNFRLLF